MTQENIKIPALVLIVATVCSLVGFVGWGLGIEVRKADRSEVAIVKTEIREDMREIKNDLKTILRKVETHMEQTQK